VGLKHIKAEASTFLGRNLLHRVPQLFSEEGYRIKLSTPCRKV
jgi:hypothetical protein